MAKVTNPLMSGEARGKALGIIFNSWRGIATVKGFKSPAQPKTTAQLLARSRLTTQVAAWKNITDLQRTDWATYSAAHLLTDWTGVPKRITGQNMFIRCNIQAIRMGGSAIASPPSASQPASPTGLALSKATADIKLAWTAPTTPATTFLEVRHYGIHSKGLLARYEQSKYLTNLAATATSPAVVLAAAAVGRHTFWIRTVDNLTGLTSMWQSLVFDMT